jgi:hypothetical protein
LSLHILDRRLPQLRGSQRFKIKLPKFDAVRDHVTVRFQVIRREALLTDYGDSALNLCGAAA